MVARQQMMDDRTDRQTDEIDEKESRSEFSSGIVSTRPSTWKFHHLPIAPQDGSPTLGA